MLSLYPAYLQMRLLSMLHESWSSVLCRLAAFSQGSKHCLKDVLHISDVKRESKVTTQIVADRKNPKKLVGGWYKLHPLR